MMDIGQLNDINIFGVVRGDIMKEIIHEKDYFDDWYCIILIYHNIV